MLIFVDQLCVEQIIVVVNTGIFAHNSSHTSLYRLGCAANLRNIAAHRIRARVRQPDTLPLHVQGAAAQPRQLLLQRALLPLHRDADAESVAPAAATDRQPPLLESELCLPDTAAAAYRHHLRQRQQLAAELLLTKRFLAAATGIGHFQSQPRRQWQSGRRTFSRHLTSFPQIFLPGLGRAKNVSSSLFDAVINCFATSVIDFQNNKDYISYMHYKFC